MISDSIPPRTRQPEPSGGASTVARAPRPRWLLPAIGAVVILAVAIGVVAGLTLNTQRGSGSAANAAGYVPANATAYYELRLDLPGDQRAALRAFLGHFAQLPVDKYLTDQLDAQLDQLTSAMPSPYRYSTDVKPWFDGTLAGAMIGVPSISSGTRPSVPDLLLFAGSRDPVAANALADRLRGDITRSGGQVTSTTHGGATIWSYQPPASSADPVRVAWTVTSNEVVFGTTADLVAAALDVHAGSRANLADRQEFRDGLARLPAERVMTVAVDTHALLTQVQKDLATAQPSAAGMFSTLTARVPDFVVASGRFTGSRFELDSSVSSSATPPANRDRGLANAAPPDAIFFADGGDVGTALATFVDAMKGSLAANGGMGVDQLQQMERMLGGDLSSFVSWMGDAAVVAGYTSGTPYVGLIVTPTNAHDASVKLLQLQGILQLGGSRSGPRVTVTDADHNGTRITTIKVQADATVPAWASTVQYAVTDSRVVIGMGETFVARVLDQQSTGSLGASERFRQAIESVGGASNVASTWLDLAALRAVLEPLVPADAASSYQSTVKPWIAPFDYLVGATRSDGQRLEGHLAIAVK